MATAAKLETEVLPAANDIVLAVEASPQIVLLEPEKFDQFYERVKAETDSLVVDLATKKGRDEVRSMAAKVTRSKTMIDKARLSLTSGWRDQTNQVNAAGKEITARLDALADDVRRPLTEWEDAEKARVEECNAVITKLALSGVVTIEDTARSVRERGKEVWETAIDPERFGDLAEQAQAAKDAAVANLKSALARLTREEEERAELEKLRAEAAERERIEAERLATERAAQEAAERAQAERERRAAAEKAEAERIERAAKEAEERVRREAEQAAQAERERVQREHDEALAAERRRAEQLEREAQAERDRIAKAEADRAAEEKRIADQKAADEANKALQRRLKTEAKEAIMSCGVSEDAAQKIVLAVRAREIPHVEWRA